VHLDDLPRDRQPQSGPALFLGRGTVGLLELLTKAIFGNLGQLAQTHPAAREISVKDAATGMPLPLHPGAQRYYREIGVIN